MGIKRMAQVGTTPSIQRDELNPWDTNSKRGA